MHIRKGYWIVSVWAIIVSVANVYKYIGSRGAFGCIYSHALTIKIWAVWLAMTLIPALIAVHLYYRCKDKYR